MIADLDLIDLLVLEPLSKLTGRGTAPISPFKLQRHAWCLADRADSRPDLIGLLVLEPLSKLMGRGAAPTSLF
ncbi:hypothetical protein CF141_19965 [Aeromonas hydrophila]|nr:hypothetical protein CF141_19965 [Aeromonas hydrophila]